MTQTRLPFELDGRAETAALTAHGGVPLVIEAFRVSGAAAVVDASVVVKRRKRGLTPSQLIEGLFSLWAAGGERCEDLAQLREDAALALLLGHGLPAPHGSGCAGPRAGSDGARLPGRVRPGGTAACGRVSAAWSRAKASGCRAWCQPIAG